MKQVILVFFCTIPIIAKAQKIDNIFVNLYTDSLKKGTFNYINIDGLLSNGKYIPLDSTQLIFNTSAGRFSGNSLWIDPYFKPEKVTITVMVKDNPLLVKQFDIYVKQLPDIEKLKTTDELMEEQKKGRKKKDR